MSSSSHNYTGDPAIVFIRGLKRTGFKFGFTLFLGAGVLTFLIISINRETAKLRSTKGERQWISSSLEAIAKLSSGRAEANQLQFLLESGLPTSLDLPTIALPAIKRLADAQQVRVSTELKGEQAASGSEPKSVEILIRADGGQQNLAAFLTSLESQQLAFRFISAGLNPFGGTGQNQMILTGQIYIR